MDDGMTGRISGLQVGATHGFSKATVRSATFVAGRGLAGDAHQGSTVRHRSRVARDPSQPNLRQVHLLASELHDELRERGFAVGAGDLGENVTTRGIDLLALPTGTVLRLGATALVALTGLRNPCRQLDRFAPGLRAAVLDRAEDGSLVRRAGVMAVVMLGGEVHEGDAVVVGLPPGPIVPLAPV